MPGEHVLITCLSHQTVSCLRVEAGCTCSLHPQCSASPMPGLAESLQPTLATGWDVLADTVVIEPLRLGRRMTGGGLGLPPCGDLMESCIRVVL